MTRKCCNFASQFSKYHNLINKITKADIINEITNNTGLQKRDVAAVIESFMECVKDSMCNKENVYLRGFGTFQVKHRAEKTARNISQKTTLLIAPHDFPGFKPAKSFVAKMQ